MSDLNTTIINIFNEWFLKQHGLLPEQAMQRIAELEKVKITLETLKKIKDERIAELERIKEHWKNQYEDREATIKRVEVVRAELATQCLNNHAVKMLDKALEKPE